jgi:flagellar motor switch protein FliG
MSKEGTVEVYENPGLRKAAIFVLVMGDALAAEIFARLTEKEIRILGQTAANLQNVSPEEVAEVLREFKRQFHGGHVPRKGAGPAFHLMLEQALGEERAMDLMGIDT